MSARARQSKSIPLIYGGIAGVVLIVIAALALVFVPPSPPTVAEFAPQAHEQIDEAPDQQSSQFGAGRGGACAPGQVCDAAELQRFLESRGVVDRARVRRCVGNPPRQIEDPQSPPCVNYWSGDNGGATSRGVTRDEIRLAIPDSSWAKTNYEVLASFFNSRFEFYGRKIRIVQHPVTSWRTPEGQRSNAVAAYEAGGFAAGSFNCFDGRCQPYWREAARLGMITVSEGTESGSEGYASLHPYAWSYLPHPDQVATQLAEFSCKSLVGRTARYAGGAERTRKRHFAVLQLGDSGLGRADTTPLMDGIRACRGEVSYHEFASQGADPAGNRLLIADLQQRGVTTIIIYGHDGIATTIELMPFASSLGYQPEWIIAGTPTLAREYYWQAAPADQTAHLFGLAIDNKGLPAPDKPHAWAYHEMGQATPEDRGEQSSTGDLKLSWIYHEMLMLASGIQAAGPKLTPESSARGLQSLKFPNPGAGGPPYYQGTVGFAGDHSMIEDAGLMWWSDTAPAYSYRASDVGGWCYLNRGSRWRSGSWPQGEPNLFDPDPRNCR